MKGGEGVEEEGGELGGEARAEGPLLDVGDGEAERELGRGDVAARHVAAHVVAPAHGEDDASFTLHT